MIRKPNRSDAKRLGTGVLVAGMAAAGAVALASPASAAGVLNSLSISPTSGTADLTHCAKYVLHGTNTDGTNGTGNVVIQTSGANVAGTNNTSSGVCNSPTGAPAGAGTSGQRNRTTQVTLDRNGNFVFYVGATQVGTVSIEADNGTTGPTGTQGTVSSNTATLNAVQTANNGVSNLAVSPMSANVTAGSPARFRLTATDSNGNPVQNVTISRNDANTTTTDGTNGGGAAATDVNGQTTYTVPGNQTNTGSTQTFYVNQTNGNGGTGGPDAGEPKATATITVIQAKNVDTLTISCPNQASNDPGNNNTCVVPADGTATIKAKAENNGQPVSGVAVHFTNNGGILSAATATTDDMGIATVTLKADTPAATNGETDTVTATADDGNGNDVNSNTETVDFQQRDAAVLVVSPGDNTVSYGDTVTENVQVDDQFGQLYTDQPESVTFTVTGRNQTSGTVQTRSTGKASFSYTDTAPQTNAMMTDNVAISSNPNLPTTDNPNGSTDSGKASPYTITYVQGGTTPSTVGLNFVTNGNQGANPSCVTDRSDPKDTTTTSTTMGATATEVCAIVKNASNQNLGGQSVTFTVSKGEVGDQNVIADNDGMTYTARTDANGVAVAYITSSTSGAQTITAAVGSVKSNTLTDTYSSDQPVFTVTSTPATVSIPAGQTQKFTVTATDQSGNGVQGEFFSVTQSGAGVLSNNTVITDSNGTGSVNVTTSSSDTGNGSITFTDQGNTNNNNQACDPSTQGSTCNATSTYNVTPTGNTGATSNVTAYLAKGATVGSTSDFASSVATDSTNKPVSGAVLQFVVSGSTSAMGTATTDSNGRAKFSFIPEHAGTLSVKVTLVSNTAVTATASGTTGKGVATTDLAQVSPQRYRIRDTATISVAKAGIQVDFYQTLASGHNKYVGSDTTNSNGVATFTIYHIKSGYKYTGIAKVASSNDDYTGPNSASLTTTVK